MNDRPTSEIWLRAPGFPRAPEDDALTNPGQSGFALARHLGDALAQRGYATEAPVGEDFGYALPVSDAAGRGRYVMISSAGEDPVDGDTYCVNVTDTGWIGQIARAFSGASNPTPALRAAVLEILETSSGVVIEDPA